MICYIHVSLRQVWLYCLHFCNIVMLCFVRGNYQTYVNNWHTCQIQYTCVKYSTHLSNTVHMCQIQYTCVKYSTHVSYTVHMCQIQYTCVRVIVMVFNATFNNISVISWRTVLLVEETRVPVENLRPAASHWLTLSHKVVLNTPHHERGSNSQH